MRKFLFGSKCLVLVSLNGDLYGVSVPASMCGEFDALVICLPFAVCIIELTEAVSKRPLTP